MKKYIQITAGRGPVECARAVTLVARELLKAIPALQLADCERHNQVDGCFMSMIFASDVIIPQAIVNEWQGTILWRSTKNPYRPVHKRSNWFVGVNFLMKWNCRILMNRILFMKPAVPVAKGTECQQSRDRSAGNPYFNRTISKML